MDAEGGVGRGAVIRGGIRLLEMGVGDGREVGRAGSPRDAIDGPDVRVFVRIIVRQREGEAPCPGGRGCDVQDEVGASGRGDGGGGLGRDIDRAIGCAGDGGASDGEVEVAAVRDRVGQGSGGGGGRAGDRIIGANGDRGSPAGDGDFGIANGPLGMERMVRGGGDGGGGSYFGAAGGIGEPTIEDVTGACHGGKGAVGGGEGDLFRGRAGRVATVRFKGDGIGVRSPLRVEDDGRVFRIRRARRIAGSRSIGSGVPRGEGVTAALEVAGTDKDETDVFNLGLIKRSRAAGVSIAIETDRVGCRGPDEEGCGSGGIAVAVRGVGEGNGGRIQPLREGLGGLIEGGGNGRTGSAREGAGGGADVEPGHVVGNRPVHRGGARVGESVNPRVGGERTSGEARGVQAVGRCHVQRGDGWRGSVGDIEHKIIADFRDRGRPADRQIEGGRGISDDTTRGGEENVGAGSRSAGRGDGKGGGAGKREGAGRGQFEFIVRGGGGADVEFQQRARAEGGIASEGAGSAESGVGGDRDGTNGGGVIAIDEEFSGIDNGGAGVGIRSRQDPCAKAVFREGGGIARAAVVGQRTGEDIRTGVVSGEHEFADGAARGHELQAFRVREMNGSGARGIQGDGSGSQGRRGNESAHGLAGACISERR